jgi:DNA-binding transcriptional regulator YdaS (Cro superfamily)
MSTIAPERRRQIAESHRLSDAYLYQCLTGRRDMDAAEARRVETITGGEIMRWMVRKDWHLIWPELIGAEGAPAVRTEVEKASA